GQVVGSTYVMKVDFSKSLADGLTTQQLLDRFVIKIASSESGSPANPVVQSPGGYSIHYDETSQFHALYFTFPNLYNGVPDFLHYVEVAHTRPNQPVLTATRLVKMAAVVVPKDNI